MALAQGDVHRLPQQLRSGLDVRILYDTVVQQVLDRTGHAQCLPGQLHRPPEIPNVQFLGFWICDFKAVTLAEGQVRSSPSLLLYSLTLSDTQVHEP